MTSYDLYLRPEQTICPQPEDAYGLYAALLESICPSGAVYLHSNGASPIRQYLDLSGSGMIWHISLLNETGESLFSPALESVDRLYLTSRKTEFSVEKKIKRSVDGTESFLQMAEKMPNRNTVRFASPTAFKIRGEYIPYPTIELMVKSLVHQWNETFPDCRIEDEDGEGVLALVRGIVCVSYDLHSTIYRLKGNAIPAFSGQIQLQNRMSGFHRQLANALLLLGTYSGIGIKTTLGMGGIQCLRD